MSAPSTVHTTITQQVAMSNQHEWICSSSLSNKPEGRWAAPAAVRQPDLTAMERRRRRTADAIRECIAARYAYAHLDSSAAPPSSFCTSGTLPPCPLLPLVADGSVGLSLSLASAASRDDVEARLDSCKSTSLAAPSARTATARGRMACSAHSSCCSQARTRAASWCWSTRVSNRQSTAERTKAGEDPSTRHTSPTASTRYGRCSSGDERGGQLSVCRDETTLAAAAMSTPARCTISSGCGALVRQASVSQRMAD